MLILNLYKFLGLLFIPIIKLNLFFRILNGKENKKRFNERFGKSSLSRPKGEIVWIHATSVGEFKSADFLINKFYKEYKILVTTTTLSAANFAEKNYGDKIIHQFAPLDIIFWVEKFLKKWRPKLVIWIESDLWPITTHLLKKNKIKTLLVNVRMSPKSFKRWSMIKFFYKQMTDCFAEIFAQSQLDKLRIEKLTNRNVKYIGNLKLSTKSNVHNKKNSNIEILKNSKVLMFASTHHKEELLFLPIIKSLLSKIKNLKIIIAPRHPERSNEILSLYKNSGISINLASENDIDENNVLIINSMGNLVSYFISSDIVFLGGSFVKKGGHNPIEPALNNCAILSGPSIYNWQNIYEEMYNDQACIIFDEILKLEKFLLDILKDSKKINNLKEKSKKFAKKEFFDSKKFIDIIDNLIEAKVVKSS